MAKKVSPYTAEMKILDQIADLMEPAAKASLLKGFKSFRKRVDLYQVAELVRRRDFEALDKLIDWQRLPEDLKELQNIRRKGVELTAKEYLPFFKKSISKMFPNIDPSQFSFNAKLGAVEGVINTSVANLVVEITTATRIAIREVVRVSLAEGIPAIAAAKVIKQSIGLNSQQAKAVTNFTNNLIDEKFGKLTKFQRESFFKGMSDEQISNAIEKRGIEKLAGQYADRQLELRSENIAKTETFRAVNEGQQQIFMQAVDAGILFPEEVEREWVVTPDQKTCPICRPLDGARAPLDGLFNASYIGVAIKLPPAHPRCRCHIALAFKSSKK